MTQTKPKPEPGSILPVRRLNCSACGVLFEQVWNPRKIKKKCPDCRKGRP